MKIRRMITGLSLLISSPLLGRIIGDLSGFSDIYGVLSFSSIIAFLGGIMFFSGWKK